MRTRSFLFPLILLVCVWQARAWDTPYTVMRLEPERLPNVWGTFANDIAETGWVTGFAYPLSGFRTVFSYHPSTGFVDLGTVSGYSAEGIGINDRGQICGVVARTGGQASFVYAPGTGFTIIGDFGPNEVNAGDRINGSGIVAGTIELANGSIRAYRYSAATGVQELGTLGGDNSRGYAINEAGWVVGTSQVADGSWHAFVFRDGEGMIDLGPGYASGINNLGVAAGISDGRPVLFRNDAIIPLGTAFGLTYVNDINDHGVVVGGYVDQQGLSQSFLATEADGLVNLNSLISPDAGWLLNANAINNSGQIAGTLSFDGAVWAAVASPIPEPSAWALFGLGAAFLTANCWRRRTTIARVSGGALTAPPKR